MRKTTAQRLKEIMDTKGLKQVDILEKTKPISERLGIRLGRNDLSQYVSGKVEPGQEKLTVLSQALGVSEVWLMGYDIDREIKKQDEFTSRPIPLLGTIAAGLPILAQENIEDYFNLDSKIKADFALRIKGDSMINAGIHEEDIVFIRKQDCLENGEIGAILIEGEATLKKFYKDNGLVILQAENKGYEPMIFSKGDLKILGKLVAVLSMRE